MSQMRCVYEFAQAGISQRNLNMKNKPVQAIFQQCPNQQADRKKP